MFLMCAGSPDSMCSDPKGHEENIAPPVLVHNIQRVSLLSVPTKLFVPEQVHSLWTSTFHRLSTAARTGGFDSPRISGDVVLALLCRLGFFTRGWLRSLGGLYSLLRNITNEPDFGLQSLHLNFNQFLNLIRMFL